jgi:hypothetical protein
MNSTHDANAPEPPQSTHERATKLLRKVDDQLLQPRSAVLDEFEQNPIVQAESRYAGAASRERVKEAVRRVVEGQESMESVAKDMQLAPASIYRWRKQYFQLLEEDNGEARQSPFYQGPNSGAFLELNTQAAIEDHGLAWGDRNRFTDNWDKLMDHTHATEADFRQDPWDVWLQTSDWTGWLYNDEGKFERSSLLGFLFLILAVLAAFLMLMINPTQTVAAKPQEIERTLTPTESLLQKDETNITKSHAVVKQFLACENWIERLQYVRFPERMKPLLQNYYTGHPDVPYKDVVPQAAMLSSETHLSIAVEIPTLEESHFFVVVPTTDPKAAHSHLIDWESCTLNQRPNFKDFLHYHPSTPTRLWVRVRKGNYYNRQFSDPAVYACYAITFPGLPETLFGYVKTDSPDGIELHVATLREGIEPGVVIEARYPQKVLDPLQVEITKLVSPEWIREE